MVIDEDVSADVLPMRQKPASPFVSKPKDILDITDVDILLQAS